MPDDLSIYIDLVACLTQNYDLFLNNKILCITVSATTDIGGSTDYRLTESLWTTIDFTGSSAAYDCVHVYVLEV